MSRSKDKGTWVETHSVRYLRGAGFPDARREVLHGGKDHGDLVLTPGVIAECKWANRGLQLPKWRRELDTEIANAGARHGILIMKPDGAGERSVHRFIGGMLTDSFHEVAGRLVSEADRAGAFLPHRGVLAVERGPAAETREYVGRTASWEFHWDGSDETYHTWRLMPFKTIMPPGAGILDTDVHVTIGPLWQFVLLLRAFGYGDPL